MKEPCFRQRLSQIEKHLAEVHVAHKYGDVARAERHGGIILDHIECMLKELDRVEQVLIQGVFGR